MDDKTKELEQVKADYLTKVKQVALIEAGIDFNDVDVYIKYINADDEKEIERQASEIVADIKQHNTAQDGYGDLGDNTVWRPFSGGM